MGTFSPNLLFSEPTPLDPSVSNIWGAILNTNFSLIDSAISAVTSIALPAQAGYPTVVLTSNSGSADQARSQHFIFTGVLTQNTLVLWPASLARFFSIQNDTTGSFTVTLAVNNGSGAAAGTTYVIPQGRKIILYSDGTNILRRSADAVSLQNYGLAATAPTDGQALTYVSSTGLWTPTTPQSLNGLTVTATTGTFTLANLKTFTVSNTLAFAGTDSTTMTFPPASANIGTLEVLQNPQSVDYTTVLADSGKHIFHPAADNNARTYTIAANASVPYIVGTVISFINDINTITIAIGGTDTMSLAGSTSTGNRTLAVHGMATAVKKTTTSWIISGAGVT